MSTVTWTIKKVDGENRIPMPGKYGIISIDVRHEVGRIPTAELRIADGDAAKQEYPATDDVFFDPGSTIEILLRYESDEEEDVRVFEGVVVRHAIASSAYGSHLVVGLKDKAVKLTGTRKTKVHVDKTDAEIIRELLKLPPAAIPQSSGKHENMVQYDCSDWDFIVMRAEALGMLVTVEAGIVSVGPVKLPEFGPVERQPRKTAEFNWGIDAAYEIELDASAEHPYGNVKSRGWDNTECQPTGLFEGTSEFKLPLGLEPATLAPVVGREKQILTHLVPPSENELKRWASARLARSHFSLLRGRIGVPGRADFKLLEWTDIKGVGARLSSRTLVTGIRHRVDVSGWRTDIQLGLSPERHCQREDIADVPAAGLLPPARGLQIGTVTAVPEPSEDGDLRVKVSLHPSSEATEVSARYVAPDMGKDHGVFFRPQVNDEVLLGFLNDDPRHPVILGSLLNKKSDVPSLLGAKDNASMGRGIVTKEGSRIGVEGEKHSVRIETKSQHGIFIDEEKGEIRLAIKDGPSITLNAEGITIDAGSGKQVSLKGEKVDVL